ncbi:MAG: chromosome partitioning protein ParB, partial [Sphingomonas sp.]
ADKGLSVREAEKMARQAKPSKKRDGNGRDTDIQALERHLGDVLGLNVRIAHGPKGGSLTLAYSTLDQLDMLCQRLTGEKI